MHLTTRCPRCDTEFQASLAQLQLRKGFVRCVHCAHIFDGYDAVVPEGQGNDTTVPRHVPPAPVPAQIQTTPTPPDPAPVVTADVPAAAFAPTPALAPAVVRQRPVPAGGPAAAVADLARLPQAAQAPGSVSVPGDAPASDTTTTSASEPVFSARHHDAVWRETDASRDDGFSISDDSHDASNRGGEPVWRFGTHDDPVADTDADPDGSAPIRAEPRRTLSEPEPVPEFLAAPPRRFSGVAFWFWMTLSLAGLVLLAAQAAVIYRVQLASQVPAARPLLERLCGVAGCQVSYPRHLSQIAILSSSLRVQPRSGEAKDGDPSQLSLLLTLRNNDERPQQWPTLMLDLTDFSGAVVVRKRLSPAEYLPPAQASGPFGARSEVALRLPISVKDAKVNGYQLKPFFP